MYKWDNERENDKDQVETGCCAMLQRVYLSCKLCFAELQRVKLWAVYQDVNVTGFSNKGFVSF